MDFSLSAFEAAVGAWFGSDEVTGRLRPAVSLICQTEADDATGLTYDQAAAALLSAMLGDHRTPELTSVTLTGAGGKVLVLSPVQARAHLTIGEWVGPAFGCIASALRVGAEMLDEINEASPSNLTITESRGEVQVCAYTQSGALGVFAFYGAAELDQGAFQSVKRIDTGTLRAIGFHARSQTAVMQPVEPRTAGFQAPSQQVH